MTFDPDLEMLILCKIWGFIILLFSDTIYSVTITTILQYNTLKISKILIICYFKSLTAILSLNEMYIFVNIFLSL